MRVQASHTGIADLYTYNPDDQGNTSGELTVSDFGISEGGVLTITNQPSYNGLCSVNSQAPAISRPGLHARNIGNGLAFQYGYFEAAMRFNPALAAGRPQAGWPSFWANSIDGANGSGPFMELDFMEAYANVGSNGLVGLTNIATTVHEWKYDGNPADGYSNNNNSISGHATTDTGEPADNFDMARFHRYGCLWTHREIKWFIDGNEVCSVPTTTPTEVRYTNGATGTAVFDVANRSGDGVYLQLGTGVNYPTQFGYVQVWQ